MEWLLLLTNLSGKNQTLRIRVWRALKSSGAVALRDGVYLLPTSEAARQAFVAQKVELESAKGSAQIISFTGTAEQDGQFKVLFDRSDEYGELLKVIEVAKRQVVRMEYPAAQRRCTQLSRELAAIAATDFFGGEARRQAESALADLRDITARFFGQDEPHFAKGRIQRLDRKNYRARTWATRQGLWIDRVASAWLIRRFIDPRAKFTWLKRIANLPKGAVGFDFDGAEFTHVGAKVTFEVLLESFGLAEDPALNAIGRVVHYLDVGGVPVEEAAGFSVIVSGVRLLHEDDLEFLDAVAPVLDGLYAAHQSKPAQ